MNRDLDIYIDEPIDSDFLESIKGITSNDIVKKIKYPNPLHTFKYNLELTNQCVNTARFMMEGVGFSAKYWLCTGMKTLDNIIKYNMKDEHYNELINISGRKDVLCMSGLPLFYSIEHTFGDTLFLVSDVRKIRVIVSCFMCDLKGKDVGEKTPPKTAEPRKARVKKAPKAPSYLDTVEDDDWEDDI